MANNEKTSKRVGKIASRALKTGKATPKEIRSLAGSALDQRPDHKGRGKGLINK